MAIGTTAAILGSAVIGAGATAAASRSQSSAIRSAANTEAQASAANLAAAERERARNEALFQPEIERGRRADSYLDALYYGNASYTPTASSAYTGGYSSQAAPNATDITRNDVYGMIDASPLAQRGREDLAAREALAMDAYTGDVGLATSDLAARYGDASAEADAIRSEADRALSSNEALLLQDYMKRQGFTDQEIAAWVANAEVGRDRAVDQVFSRGGVNGMIGQTRRGVAQVEQDYARDRAQYEAGQRRADYDQYANPRYAAYGARDDAYMGATQNYWNRRNTAYDAYSGANSRAWDNLSGRRASAYDTAAGDWRTAYADTTGYWSDQSGRGAQGRGAVAGAGQTTLGITTAERTRAAQAAADAAYARANVTANAYNNYGNIVGDALGAILTQKRN